MAIDRKRMQIIRLRVTYKDGTSVILETAVPSVGSVDEIMAVVVEGLGDPIKLNGEWAAEEITSEMWDEI